MRSAMMVIVSVFLVLFSSLASLAQRQRYTLQGMVIQTANDPLIRIRLLKSGTTIQETVLSESGFTFFDVSEGRYTLVAEAAGYELARQDVEFPGEFPVLDLRAQRSAEGKAESVGVWDLKIPQLALREFEAGKNKLLDQKCTDALSHLRKAIRSYAAYGDAHKAMGECHTLLNELDAAEKAFKQALEQVHTPELHLQLGTVYARQNKLAQLLRQIGFYVNEAKPGPLRDRLEAFLSKYR
jgi:tetratricopeptide (TPR) repeat protein